MFLKRLEIIGFKSFADPISIEFDKGVTAVVGPNGSGKSNISDGIRWVLGEQSAKSLRGSKMEDIIFAGSDTRKPLNFAEVTLVLDNSDQYIPLDYVEVSVTRRVYRSGESEYLLNKQPCRLKDIIDVFLDSGLGKEAFSIIGQGKVEEILSSKSEDRRVIFEEAAGVLKYKTRKIKAEKKLAETEENLHRVEDIIYELESQIEPLQIQSSIAKDYLEKKEQLKEIEVALIVHEISELHEIWQEKKEQLASLEEKKNSLFMEVSNNKEKQDELRTKLRELDDMLHNLQAELLQTSEALEKAEGQKELYKERRKNALQNKDQIKRTIATLREKEQNYEAMFEKERKKESELQEEVATIKEQHNKLQSQLQSLSENIEERIEQLKSDYIEMLNEQASVRNEMKFLNDQLQSLKSRKSELVENNQHLLSSREQILAKKEEKQRELAEKEQALNELVVKYRTVKQELEKSESTYQTRQSKLYEAYQLIQQIRSRKEVIEEMQSDFSGYFQGVKEVLKARNHELDGIVGAVAELVQVPKQYEMAIEIALGGALQHIVTESEEDARRAIQFLKKNRYGRATFLPLTVIKGRHVNTSLINKLKEHSSFIGIASKLIQYDDKFSKIIDNLLGHVIVASDLQGANDLARMTNYSMRIVTVEGDVVNTGGSMTGGSMKQRQTPILGRKREVEELTEKLQQIEQKTTALEKDVKQLKMEIKMKSSELEEVREAGEQARTELQNVQMALSEIELEEKSLNEQLSLFDRSEETLNREENEIMKRMDELTISTDELAIEIKSLERKIESYEQKRKDEQSLKGTLEANLTQLKVQLAKAEERLMSQRETVLRLEQEKSELKQQVEEVESQYEVLETEMNDSSLNEQTIEEHITKQRKQKELAIEKITSARKERTSLEEQLQLERNKEREKEFQLQHVQEELHQCEVNVNRLDVKLDKMLEQLQNDYELSYEGAKAAYELQMDPDEAKTKVQLIKLAIAELGTVNLGAIEEYERISERYQFLCEQQTDLHQAKDTLHQVISEMDEEMTRRFKETFDQIRYHFQRVYKKLFGGGEADLVLTDTNDLLHTGVEIIARPPGKKLQNLALLSGGERALTAIALLFAILNVRPVPFCVLDEVEAALDEANVSRFASYLREFSSNTQFIVITHRKGTMEEADVLYGVTMQESGVSKLVSVRLEESEEYIPS